MNDPRFDVPFFKKILAIQNPSRHEKIFAMHILQEIQAIPGVTAEMDVFGNILAKKGVPESGQKYPCVGAHLDSVHKQPLDFTPYIQQDDDKLTAWNSGHNPRRQVGIGGDDKCGIYICCLLLRSLPVLKCAFFVEEEIGCNGSRSVDGDFFANVGYFIEFDSPGHGVVTHVCMGVELFKLDSAFGRLLDEVIKPAVWASHPYTDVWPVRSRFGIACANLPAGYYDYHTAREWVSIDVVHQSFLQAEQIINQLGGSEHHE